MGAKTWMIAFVDGNAAESFRTYPPLDRTASAELARQLFPSETLEPLDDGSLAYTNPPDDEIVIGCFPSVSVVAAKEFGIDYPSSLPRRFLERGLDRVIYLHAMHSVVDWFAFAIWERGRLIRSLSLSPDSGVLEDIGEKRSFELPYWNGEFPAVEPSEQQDYPFPFHPLELGEAALKEFFGYQLEGMVDERLIEAEDIPLLTFRRGKPSLFKRLFSPRSA